MVDIQILVNEACKVISRSMGETSAEMYRKFYLQRSQTEIISSLGEILNELYGPGKAQKEIRAFKKSINIK